MAVQQAMQYGDADFLNTIDAFYKELFPQRRLENTAIREHPFLSKLRKMDDLEGDGIHIPIKYGTSQQKGAVFSNAQSGLLHGKHSSVAKRWYIQRNRYYQFVTLDDETVAAARSRKGAFLNLKEEELSDTVKEVGQYMAQAVWNDGTGNIGEILSVTDGDGTLDMITLDDADDAINFNENQRINLVESDDTVQTESVAIFVGRVDDDAGTVYCVDQAGDPLDLVTNSGTLADAADAVSCYCVNHGDQGLYPTGVDGWIPASAPSSGESFFTVDRSSRPVHLAGHRQAWLGSIEETVMKLDSKMRRFNRNKSDVVNWVSFANFHRLSLELGSRAIRDEGMAAKFGFPTIGMNSPGGMIATASDPFLLSDKGYLLAMSTWEIHHLRGLPHIVASGGGQEHRAEGSDGVEIRIRCWWEMACPSPIKNGRYAIT